MLQLILTTILCRKPIVSDVETQAQRPEITYLSYVARKRRRYPGLP